MIYGGIIMKKKRLLPLLMASIALAGTAVSMDSNAVQAKTHHVSKKHTVKKHTIKKHTAKKRKAKKKVTKRKSRKATKKATRKLNIAKYQKSGRFHGTKNDFYIQYSVPEMHAYDVYYFNGMMMEGPYGEEKWLMNPEGNDMYLTWSLKLTNHTKQTVNVGQFIKKHFKVFYQDDPSTSLDYSNDFPEVIVNKYSNYIYKYGAGNFNKNLKPNQSCVVMFGYKPDKKIFDIQTRDTYSAILNNDGKILYQVRDNPYLKTTFDD